MRSWEEKINGETEEKKMNRQADFTDGSSSFDDGFDKLYEKIKTMYRDDELETVKRAYNVAKEHHKNQLRQSGEPYIIHPIAVAAILADLGRWRRLSCTILSRIPMSQRRISSASSATR